MTFDFNPEEFKNAAVTEATADRYAAFPVGDYTGTITEAMLSDNGGQREDGTYWLAYDIKMDLTDPVSGRTKNVRLGFPVSFTRDKKVSSTGNVMLGQLRTAIGKNSPGQHFSWTDPMGHTVTVMVGHRRDKNDPEKVYEQAKAWRAA